MCRHGGRTAAAGRIHDAVDDNRRAFEHGIPAEHREAPGRLQLTCVRRGDLRQRGIVRALVVAPVHRPVVRLCARIDQTLIRNAAGDLLRDRLAQVARLLHPEEAHEVGDVVGRQPLRVIVRHQRLILDGDRRLVLVDQMETARGVDDLSGERVFVSSHAANVTSVGALEDEGHRRRTTASPATAARARHGRQRLVRRHDFLTDCHRGQAAGVGQIGTGHTAARVNLVTAGTSGAAEEQRFARRDVSFRHNGAARRSGRRRGALKASNVADELPHLLVAKALVGRHLRALDALADRAEEVGVAVAVLQSRGVQRGTAAPGIAHTGGAVAGLAGAVKRPLALRGGGQAGRQRIGHGICRRRLLREKRTGGDSRNRACDEFDPIVHSVRDYNPWPEHPRP